MSRTPEVIGRRAVRYLEQRFDAAFGPDGNPLRHLGALGFLFFWIVVFTGIYLYIALDTSASGAYQSIDSLSRSQPYLGGVLRSMHRYAADAFVVVMVAHLLREMVFGHFHGFRHFSWLTGVPLLALGFACGLIGFWLNWDQLALYSVESTVQWLDAVPFFGSPLARNFLNAATVSDRLFSLFVFMHLGLPLLMLFGLWFHIQRISKAEVFPSRALAAGAAGSLFLLALAAPVLSQAPADMAHMPEQVPLDWFYLFVHPLVQATSAPIVWALLTSSFATLLVLPYLGRKKIAPPVAVVTPVNCNGCRRCFDDCPYAAVTMVSHPNTRVGRQLAQVDPDLCASCGICVGSCPSSTPFRSVVELVTGIDLPDAPINQLRNQLRLELGRLRTANKVVVFGCDHGAAVEKLQSPEVAAISLVCSGMLPPSFIEYALRDGASGVLVSTCKSGGCEFRLGPSWAQQRLTGVREPALRSPVPKERLLVVSADIGEDATLHSALAMFQQKLSVLGPCATTAEII